MALREIFFLCVLGAAVVVLANPKDAGTQKLSSAQIESVLKAGPHAVIRAFEVEPAYRDKAFVGFRIMRINPHPVFGVASQIKIGDILVSANGVRIETPGQFMGAWQKLKTAKSVTIRFLRDGQPKLISWSVDR